jgi:hypothetical protein
LNDGIDRSAWRLKRLLKTVDRFKNDCGAESAARDAISDLGDFRVGMAVKALVELLDHPNEGHRATARTSLLRIRNAMGHLWLDGSLAIICRNAENRGDHRTYRNGMKAVVDLIGSKLLLGRMLPKLRGPDGEDLRLMVRLAAKVSDFDVADRLMDIAFDSARDDILRMLALESLTGAVAGLDEECLEYLGLMLAVETVRLSERHADSDIDWILERADEVLRVIHERIDDIARDIDVH